MTGRIFGKTCNIPPYSNIDVAGLQRLATLFFCPRDKNIYLLISLPAKAVLPLAKRESFLFFCVYIPPLAKRTMRISIVCDANAKKALVATKGGLPPPRSVL